MILTLSNGNQIRGDLIISATLRSDLAPIPVTLEADIRVDGSMDKLLAEGGVVTTASGDGMRIIKSVNVNNREVQGEREMRAIRISAILDACHTAAFVRSRAIIKERVSLSSIYRAAGCSIKSIDADFPVPRFYCPIGETPTFGIAIITQEEGGVVRWKAGGLQFMRLIDMFRQKAVKDFPDNASDNVESGFLERHEVPWFYSLNDSGVAVFGNREKPRAVRFSPFKDASRLQNMTRCVIHRKTVKGNPDMRIIAGDMVNIVGGNPMCVITAANVFESGTDDGGSQNSYTRLWLGELG